jgi:CheY-like chemotaxis protein
LVVDDEETVLQVSKRMLEKCGLSVLTASDGKEGVETFRNHSD